MVSEAELARAEADQQLLVAQQRQAARVVASAAHDVKDAQLLLSILGLDAEVVGAARQERGAGGAGKTRKRGTRAAA